jgi:hypothetical protein
MSIIHCALVLYFASRLNSIKFSPLACSKIPLKCLFKTVDTCHSCAILFFYNLFTKSTDKIHCRYEAPREEPREAHGYLALGCDGCMVALSVDVDR